MNAVHIEHGKAYLAALAGVEAADVASLVDILWRQATQVALKIDHTDSRHSHAHTHRLLLYQGGCGCAVGCSGGGGVGFVGGVFACDRVMCVGVELVTVVASEGFKRPVEPSLHTQTTKE